MASDVLYAQRDKSATSIAALLMASFAVVERAEAHGYYVGPTNVTYTVLGAAEIQGHRQSRRLMRDITSQVGIIPIPMIIISMSSYRDTTGTGELAQPALIGIIRPTMNQGATLGLRGAVGNEQRLLLITLNVSIPRTMIRTAVIMPIVSTMSMK